MAKVYGLEVADDRMARIAKMLLNAHLFMIVVCALYGIVQCAEHFAIQGAMDDWRTKSGEEDTSGGGFLSGSVAVIYGVGGPLILPVLGFFIARAGIQGNNQGILQGTCIMNGYCIGCTGCFAVMGVLSFVSMLEQKSWLEKGTCMEDGFHHPDQAGVHRVDDYSKADCTAATETLHDLYGISATIEILLVILCCCNVFACSLGTAKANEAHNALLQQQVFTGRPGMPGMAGMPGQPGTIMVVGQPIGTEVPMGQPVGNAMPPADPNAKVQS